MSIGAADLHTAVQTLWVDSGLDWAFRSYWPSDDQLRYPSLHDTEATPGQPMPYCVFGQSATDVVTRMTSGTSRKKLQTHDVPWEFRVHAQASGDLSAKEVAATLAEAIMEKFGGHPETAPQQLVLEHGAVLKQFYATDFGIRTGDSEHQWTIRYVFRLDVPVMV